MDTFANRAHNDVLELWLETGVFGLVLMTVFGFWFIGRSLASWRGAISQEFPVDGTLARAATIIIGLLVAHSLVDYPLRTNAILAVFVFCCALLLPPFTKARSVASIAQPQGVPSASRRPIAGERVRRETAPTPTQIPRAKTRWGQDVDWPKEWQSQGSPPKDEPPP